MSSTAERHARAIADAIDPDRLHGMHQRGPRLFEIIRPDGTTYRCADDGVTVSHRAGSFTPQQIITAAQLLQRTPLVAADPATALTAVIDELLAAAGYRLHQDAPATSWWFTWTRHGLPDCEARPYSACADAARFDALRHWFATAEPVIYQTETA